MGGAKSPRSTGANVGAAAAPSAGGAVASAPGSAMFKPTSDWPMTSITPCTWSAEIPASAGASVFNSATPSGAHEIAGKGMPLLAMLSPPSLRFTWTFCRLAASSCWSSDAGNSGPPGSGIPSAVTEPSAPMATFRFLRLASPAGSPLKETATLRSAPGSAVARLSSKASMPRLGIMVLTRDMTRPRESASYAIVGRARSPMVRCNPSGSVSICRFWIPSELTSCSTAGGSVTGAPRLLNGTLPTEPLPCASKVKLLISRGPSVGASTTAGVTTASLCQRGMSRTAAPAAGGSSSLTPAPTVRSHGSAVAMSPGCGSPGKRVTISLRVCSDSASHAR